MSFHCLGKLIEDFQWLWLTVRIFFINASKERKMVIIFFSFLPFDMWAKTKWIYVGHRGGTSTAWGVSPCQIASCKERESTVFLQWKVLFTSYLDYLWGSPVLHVWYLFLRMRRVNWCCLVEVSALSWSLIDENLALDAWFLKLTIREKRIEYQCW